MHLEIDELCLYGGRSLSPNASLNTSLLFADLVFKTISWLKTKDNYTFTFDNSYDNKLTKNYIHSLIMKCILIVRY